MSVVNVSGAPIKLILASLGSIAEVPIDRAPDSTWTSGDSAYVSFVLASMDSVNIAENWNGGNITEKDVPFDTFRLLGDGIDISATDAAVMSLFVERDGNLVFRVLPRAPAEHFLESTYRRRQSSGNLVSVSFYIAGASATLTFDGDSTAPVRYRRTGNHIVFMKHDDTLCVGDATVGRRCLFVSGDITGDSGSRREFRARGW